jgi:hypothetical protein
MQTPKSDLYRCYTSWAEANGHRPLAQGRLIRRLGERGLVFPQFHGRVKEDC